MNKALEYLKNREWSMGNGQCPDCCGVPASWHGHPCYMTTESIGHEAGCSMATALTELGEMPLMKGEFKSDDEFEHFISDSGVFGTRPKTAIGCQRYRDYADELQRSIGEALAAAFKRHNA